MSSHVSEQSSEASEVSSHASELGSEAAGLSSHAADRELLRHHVSKNPVLKSPSCTVSIATL